MPIKDLMLWRRPSSNVRELLQPIERFFERPWSVRRGEDVKYEIQETPQEIVVSAELAGWNRDDIRVDISESTVSISASRTQSGRQRAHGLWSHEQRFQNFMQRLSLPAPIKTGASTATFKNGRLEIHLPRVREAEIRRVNID